MSDHAPALMSFAEFARHAGFKPSYVTQLKREGRLVLSDDGKAVKAAESLARIQETRDPSKAAVAARHAAARASAAQTAADAPPASAPPAPEDDDLDAGLQVRHDYQAARAAAHAPAIPPPSAPAEAGKIGNTFQAARALKERYLAMSAKRDYEVSMRALLPAAEVENALTDAVTQFRMRIESLPSILGPQLAAITDEAQATATIADAMEHILEELSRQFAAITKATQE